MAIEWHLILELGPVVWKVTGGGGCDTAPHRMCDSPEPNRVRVKACQNNSGTLYFL